MPLEVVWCATEISGDVVAAQLARELRAIDATIHMSGLGGSRMRAAGVDVRVDISGSGAVGFVDWIRHLPRFVRAYAEFRRLLDRVRPDAVIVVDAPGFSFPAARAARRRGLFTVYFVPPPTWCWSPRSAVARLRSACDLVIPTLEREAELYRREGLRTIYCGHPVVDAIAGRSVSPNRNGAASRPRRIGLLPGSRRHEIERLLPVMLEAVLRLERAIGRLQVLIAPASAEWDAIVSLARERLGRVAEVVRTDALTVLTDSDVTMAASGSVLLEACLVDAPVVVLYRVDPLSALVATRVIRIERRIPFFSLPNLLANEAIVPELFQSQVTPDRIVEAALTMLGDEERLARMREGYARARLQLGDPGAVRRIAEDLLGVIFASRRSQSASVVGPAS